MEYTKNEVAVVEEAIQHVAEAQMVELFEMELAYVGGGIGDPIAA